MSLSETPLEGTLSKIEEELSSGLFSPKRYLIFTLTGQDKREHQLFIPDTDSKSIYLDNIIQGFHRKEEIKFKGTYSYDTVDDPLRYRICLSSRKPFIFFKKNKDKLLEIYQGTLSVNAVNESYEIFNFQGWRRTIFKISKK